MSINKDKTIIPLSELKLDLLLKLGNHKERPISYLKEVLAIPNATNVQRAVAHYFLHERYPELSDKIHHLREVKRLLSPSAARAKIMIELADLGDELEENCKAVVEMQEALASTQAMAHFRLGTHASDQAEKIRHYRIARHLHVEAWRKADSMLRLIELGDEVEANCRGILAMADHADGNLNAKPQQIEIAREKLGQLKDTL